MARGIIIFGSAGSGKTSLGKLTAAELGFPYFDIDEYIWRKDTEIPFSQMYSREEKASRLMADISQNENFVMAGTMDSFHKPFDPLFDLAVHITAPVAVRMERLHQREYQWFGDRILEGGDMYEGHQHFLDMAARYDTDGSPCLKTHMEWVQSLPCKVLYLDGQKELEQNKNCIVATYIEIMGV